MPSAEGAYMCVPVTFLDMSLVLPPADKLDIRQTWSRDLQHQG